MKKIFLLIILISFLLVGCKEINSPTNEKESILFIELDEDLRVGKTTRIDVTSDLEDDEITLINETPDIIRIEDEVITGLKEGTGLITIVSKYKTIEHATIEVLKNNEVTGISLSLLEEGPYLVNKTYHLNINIDNGSQTDVRLDLGLSKATYNWETKEIVFPKFGSFTLKCSSYKNVTMNDTLEIMVDLNPDIEYFNCLYVGNSITSYDFNIPEIVSFMMSEMGIHYEYNVLTIYQNIRRHKEEYVEAMSEDIFTHVCFQESEQTVVEDYQEFESATVELCGLCNYKYTQFMIYENWVQKESFLGSKEAQELKMATTKESSENVAKKINGTIARSGEAFMKYLESSKLPSLYSDEIHPSCYGAFLSACVHYVTLTGRKASDNPYVYEGVDEETAKLIKQIADEYVSEYRKLKVE